MQLVSKRFVDHAKYSGETAGMVLGIHGRAQCLWTAPCEKFLDVQSQTKHWSMLETGDLSLWLSNWQRNWSKNTKKPHKTRNWRNWQLRTECMFGFIWNWCPDWCSLPYRSGASWHGVMAHWNVDTARLANSSSSKNTRTQMCWWITSQSSNPSVHYQIILGCPLVWVGQDIFARSCSWFLAVQGHRFPQRATWTSDGNHAAMAATGAW